jgi:hypothetical protein
MVVGFAFVVGLRPIVGDDLFFLLNDARWLADYGTIPRVDHFSYTVPGAPWIYPLGGGLIFYSLYLVGGYAALSCFAAAALAATTALLVRGGSAILAVVAVPLVYTRTNVRADAFTTVLTAAFLVLLWDYHRTGRGRLWLLPMLMAAWVNLHLGFVTGLGVVAVYLAAEALEALWPDRRAMAMARAKRALPWLFATFAATLLNPFGLGIYGAVRDQFAAPQLELMTEWQPVPIDWTTLSHIFSLGNAAGGIMLVMVIAVALAAVALYRRQLGAAVILAGAAAAAPHHLRFEALLGIVTAIVGGEFVRLPKRLAAGAAVALVGAYCVVVTPRPFLGLSREYPAGAVDFIEKEHIPAQVLPTRFGAYFVWRLWPGYLDYWDARTIPFGQEGMARLGYLTSQPPDAPGWQREAERYNINAVLAVRGPLGFRMHEFCASDQWAPVYLDKVSAVFVRRRRENEKLIERLRIDCNEAQRRSGLTP